MKISSKKDNKFNVAKTGLIYLISTILIKGIIFITMPLFTKILTVQAFGIYNAYMSYEGTISIAFALGGVLAIRNARIEYETSFEKFKSSLFYLEFFVFIVTLCIAVLLKKQLSAILGMDESIVLCLVIHSFGSALITLTGEIWRVNYKANKVLILSLIITASNIMLSLFFIHFIFIEKMHVGRILGSAIPAILFIFAVFIRYLFLNRKMVSRTYWAYILKLGIPGLPYILSENLLVQSDRIMIERYVGAYQAGIYSAISTIASILLIVEGGLNSAWEPWLYRTLSDEKELLVKQYTNLYVGLGGILTIGFSMIAPELIQIFTGRMDYLKFAYIIYPLIGVQYFNFLCKVSNNLQFFFKKAIFPSIGICGCAAFNIFLNYFLLQHYPFVVTSMTSLCAIIMFCIYNFIMTKIFRYNNYYNLWALVFESLLTASIVLFNYYFINNILIRYLFTTVVSIVIGFLLYIFYKQKDYIK
ncbi:oligosaccharide flippase family protein [Lachnospiraceae bacterium 62-35]